MLHAIPKGGPRAPSNPTTKSPKPRYRSCWLHAKLKSAVNETTSMEFIFLQGLQDISGTCGEDKKKIVMVQRKQAHDSWIGWCDDLLLEVDKKGEPNNSGCSRGGEATCAWWYRYL